MECHYKDGLRFSCTRCRYCCGVEPGYVFLTEEDVLRLSGHFTISVEAFIETYCRKVPVGGISYISLLEKENNDCIFLESFGCGVYESRPLQCRTYPFWATIVETGESWAAEAASCPGIGKGRLYSREEIEELVRLRQGKEPWVVTD